MFMRCVSCAGYAIPAFIMIVCYSVMISSLIAERKAFAEGSRSDQTHMKTMAMRNTKIRNATIQLIKTVILMGISFIVCLCLDSVITLLNALGLYRYVFNTPIQKLGMMLIAVNCAVGPAVTFLLVPVLRGTALAIVRRAFCVFCPSAKKTGYFTSVTTS